MVTTAQKDAWKQNWKLAAETLKAYQQAGVEPPRELIIVVHGLEKARAILDTRADIQAKTAAKQRTESPRELARRVAESGRVEDPEVRRILRAAAIRNGGSTEGLEADDSEPTPGPSKADSSTPAKPAKPQEAEKYDPAALAAELIQRTRGGLVRTRGGSGTVTRSEKTDGTHVTRVRNGREVTTITPSK
ncbi:hypothetical protein I5Q34_27670 [Streptomyces sp. AV19]|uniref:hypothetical protein n=1 Tax=Streptomyces sp. AV19 TaxID=2793068 RepID=UPI0018FE412E|nr:hypothetical protein [Streptomyces sp. AV19]MBH1938005.1 hypothetical protein [Streptomyces sp. AV19]MDG4536620.1 hypothetical protein [Streptomyces sp. AV19]